MTNISIVIPVFNERENIAKLHREILEVAAQHEYTLQIVVVDDGSTDGTDEVCHTLSPVQYIRLRRNFGQSAAMDAGIRSAFHEYVVTMDGDGQNNPADIPNLLEALHARNADCVAGWRRNRKDTFPKRFVSNGALMLRRILLKDGIHDSGCSLRIYRSECLEELNLYGEMHRFIPAILISRGFSVEEIEVTHRPRTAGVSKYNFKRIAKGFLDMIAVWYWHRYSARPLHLLGSAGLALSGIGVIFGGVLLWQYLSGMSMSDTALPLFSAFLVLAGVQLFGIGILADISTRIYFDSQQTRSYTIKENETY